MRWLILINIASLVVYAHSTFAQSYEDIFEQFEDANLPELTELFRELIARPVPINSVAGDSLAKLWFLNEEQIAAVIALHRQKAPALTL